MKPVGLIIRFIKNYDVTKAENIYFKSKIFVVFDYNKTKRLNLLGEEDKKLLHDYRDGSVVKKGQRWEGRVLAKPSRYLWQLFARCEAASVQALFTIYLSR